MRWSLNIGGCATHQNVNATDRVRYLGRKAGDPGRPGRPAKPKRPKVVALISVAKGKGQDPALSSKTELGGAALAPGWPQSASGMPAVSSQLSGGLHGSPISRRIEQCFSRISYEVAESKATTTFERAQAFRAHHRRACAYDHFSISNENMCCRAHTSRCRCRTIADSQQPPIRIVCRGAPLLTPT